MHDELELRQHFQAAPAAGCSLQPTLYHNFIMSTFSWACAAASSSAMLPDDAPSEEFRHTRLKSRLWYTRFGRAHCQQIGLIGA